jgi:hypothetical protein
MNSHTSRIWHTQAAPHPEFEGTVCCWVIGEDRSAIRFDGLSKNALPLFRLLCLLYLSFLTSLSIPWVFLLLGLLKFTEFNNLRGGEANPHLSLRRLGPHSLLPCI